MGMDPNGPPLLGLVRVQRSRSGPVFGIIIGLNLNSVSVSVLVYLGHGLVRS